MKKNLLRLSVWAATLLMASTLTSCVTETDETPAAATVVKNGGLTINITTDEYRDATRATDITTDPGTAKENTINNMVIGIFSSDGATKRDIQYVEVSANASSATINTESALVTTASSEDIVLIACNVSETAKTALLAKTTATEFREVPLNATDLIDEDENAIVEDNLPMMGNGTLDDDGNGGFTTDVIVYHLTSKVSLVSLKTNFTSASEKFQPTKVFLVNVPEKIDFNCVNGTYTFPTLGNTYYQGGSNNVATDWSETAGDDKTYNEAFGSTTIASPVTLYGTKAWSSKYYFYSLPSNNTTAKEELRLVVQGYYTNTGGTRNLQYYPVVISKLTGNSVEKAMPNVHYDISMIISGPGTTSPYNDPAMTYTVEANVTVGASTTISGAASFGASGVTYSATATVHNPQVGEFLYADGTWGKYPQTSDIVGVIFSNTAYDDTYTHGMAFALKDASAEAAWSNNTSADNTGVTQLTYTGSDKTDQAAAYDVMSVLTASGNNGLANTNGTATASFIGSSVAEAFYAAKNYGTSVSGFTNSGWFLPSIGELMTMCYNVAGSTALDPTSYVTTDTSWGDDSGPWGIYYAGKADQVRVALNNLLKATAGVDGTDFNYFSGGAQFGADVTGNESLSSAAAVHYWSSSEWSATRAFNLNFSSDGYLGFYRGVAKSVSYRVRPVLAF